MDARHPGITLRKRSVAEGNSPRWGHPLLRKRIELDPLTCFAFLVAWQALANQGSFGVADVLTDAVWWLTNLCLVLLLLRPSSLALLAAAATLNVVSSWKDLPYQVNHLLLEDVVNLTILSSIIIVWFRHRREHAGWATFNSRERRAEIFQLFAPAARLSVVLLYFFVTLAKLNEDFFDPIVSCAAEMYRDIVQLDLTNPLISWTATAAIVGTLLAEGGIPVLLLFRKTRTLGIVSGLCFHLLLAFHPHGGVFGFSSLMFALLFLFTGERFTATARSHLDRLRSLFGNPRYRRRYIICALGGLLAVAVAATTATVSRERLPFFLWLFSAIPVIAFILITLLRTPPGERHFRGPFFAKPILLYVFPLLVLLNGAAPYVGLKTETSFSMFSNLRTEDGVTNHLFIPTSWQLMDYQDDLVRITSSDLPELHELAVDGYLLTRFEFERILHEHDNFSVSCQCYGSRLDITKEDGDISGFEQDESFSPWLGGVLHFREVSRSDMTPCTH